MKVFFAVSLRVSSKYAREYKQIYNLIEKFGFKNLNDLPVMEDPEKFYQLDEESLAQVHINLSGKLKSADIVVIDATIHSLTMGFYIKMALDLDKPTIILHQPGSKPYYFSAIQNERLQILEYTQQTLSEVLKHGLSYASENTDSRFNLFLSSDLYNYLKWVARRYNTQKSNYIRSLLLKDKDQHLAEYKEDLKK